LRSLRPALAGATRALLLAASAALLPAAAAGQDSPEPVLDPVVVEDTRLLPERDRDAAQALEELRRTPGGVALVPEEEIARKRATTFEDVLETVPGVLVRSRGTGEEPQISIRGSGLRNNFHSRGVNLIVDGFPFQNADGFGDFESFELLAAKRLEVLKGPSSMRFGGNTLGGAIHIVTRTGRDEEPIRLRGEGGSFGFVRSFASGGLQRGPWDALVALSHTEQRGYRQHARQDRQRLLGTVGHAFSGGADLRLDVHAVRNRQEIPGALTREAFRDDPRQADPAHVRQRAARDYEFGRGALTLEIPVGETTRLAWRGQVHYQDLWHPLAFGIIEGRTWSGATELRVTGERDWLGVPHALEGGLQLAMTRQPQEIHANLGGRRGPTFSRQLGEASNLAFYLTDELLLHPQLSLVGSLRVQHIRRAARNRIADTSDRTRDTFATPSLGLVWRAFADVELYAGAGRMVEPPLLLEALAPGNLDGDLSDLAPQRAWHFELGARGRLGERLGFDVALYDVEVRNEIRNVNVDPTGLGLFTIPRFENLRRTRHYGLELGIDLLLARDLLAGLGLPAGDTLRLETAYTLSRNVFVDHPRFGSRDLPGAPRHVVHGGLRWQHARGFWIAPRMDVAAGDWFADSANAVGVPGAVLFHVRLGYDHEPSGLSAFFEVRNLADRRHVSALVVDNAVGRYFQPGDGRAFYGGLAWRWR
jgi:iron complex outermembrane recepter protein